MGGGGGGGGAKRPGSRGELTSLSFRGETTRGETTRGEIVRGRNILLPDNLLDHPV